MNTIELNILTEQECGASPERQRMGRLVCGGDGITQMDELTLYTIEKPWLPNELAPDEIGAGIPFKSCVPLGEYTLVQRTSPSKGLRWHFYNEDLGVFLEYTDCRESWHRYSCMFHIGNFVRNVVGCAAVGLRLYTFATRGGGTEVGVRSSAVGIRQFQQHMKEIMGDETEARLIIK